MARMRQTDWTRLLPRPKWCESPERIVYLVEFLVKARGSDKSKQRAVSELRKLLKGKRTEQRAISKLINCEDLWHGPAIKRFPTQAGHSLPRVGKV